MIQRILTALVVCLLVIGGTITNTWAAEQNGAKPATEKPRQPDVIFVPTPHDVVERMLKEAKVTKKDVVYDLGCGDGRIVAAAAKKFGCRCFGYDIDPERIEESLKTVKKHGVEHLVTITKADIFKLDLSKASVVTLYLLPDLNVRLIPQLRKLKPGSRIVSHDFAMRGVVPDKVIRIKSKDDSFGHRIYLWTTPLKEKGKNSKRDDFNVVKIGRELKIVKTSQLKSMRRKALKQYRAQRKAWQLAKKQAEEAKEAFNRPKPKKPPFRVAAANLATEELAKKKLDELKTKGKRQKKKTSKI